MSNLTGNTIKDTYGGVLNIGPSGATGAQLRTVTDGFGTTLPFEISPTTINFTGTVTGITGIGSAGSSGTSGTSGVNGAGGATGYYFSGYDVLDQANAGATAENIMLIRTTDIANGVSIVSNSRITIANTGEYNLQFSAQFRKTTGGEDDVTIWLKKNGNNVDESAGTLTVTGNPGAAIASWNYLFSATAGDYYELAWSSADTTMELHHDPAAIDPTRPAIPSIIVTVAQVMYSQAGATGASGTSGSSGSSGVSGSSGSSGVSGSSGSSGVSGSSGSSGVSGSSGSSGISGSSGTSGNGFTYQNIWSVFTSYQVNDVVSYNGSSYIAIQAGTGFDPVLNLGTYWQYLSVAGTSGSSGSSGAAGSPGSSGTSGSSGSSGVSAGGGLVNGVGADSLISASSLTTSPALAGGNCGIALGNGACSAGGRTISIGELAGSGSANTVNIGYNASSPGSEGVAIGYNAKGSGSGGIVAIGYDACAGGADSVAVGQGARATSTNRSVAVGGQSIACGDSSIAIGRAACACSASSIAIGYLAVVPSTVGCAVALGPSVTAVVGNTTHVNCFYIASAASYADNAAAITAGLTAGQVYRTSTGTLQIVY